MTLSYPRKACFIPNILSNNISWAGADWLLFPGYSMRNYTCNKFQIFDQRERLEFLTKIENANFSSFLKWPFHTRERLVLYPTYYQTISPGQEPIGSCSWVILWEITHAINFKFFIKRNALNFWPKSKIPIFLFFLNVFFIPEKGLFYT